MLTDNTPRVATRCCQWLPEIARREKLKSRGKLKNLPDVDRHFMITVSLNVPTDSKTANRWGTGPVEPPIDQDGAAYKAIAHR